MKSNIKKILIIISMIFYTINLVGCNGLKEIEEKELIQYGNGYKLKISDEDIFTTRENICWFPNPNTKENPILDGAIGKCKEGYIFTTSSENCLYIDSLHGTIPYYVYREGFNFTPVSSEYVKEAALISYADRGYSKYDKGPAIDMTKEIESILEIYNQKGRYIEKKFNYEDIIGEIVLKNSEDEGLLYHIEIFFDGKNYYMEKNEKYICCNQIIPENINILKEYKESIFNK